MEVVKIKTKDVARREGEIIKPIEIISIEGMEDWSLVDRRTWNLLLLNAWSDRLEDPTADFTIPLRELRGLHDSNDRIWETLKRLQTTLVEARLPDGSLQCVQMLGSTNLKDKGREEGYLKYDFHRKLVPILRNSEIYARMEMKVITAFTSKYSLALYEALAARIELRKSLEIMSVADLRRWFGVEKKKLSTWSNFLKFAIQPALLEVNALSPFLIEIEPIKHGRKVVKVKVSWSKKEPFSPEEQKAAYEVNQHRIGRNARLNDCVENIIPENIELSNTNIQKGYDAAAPICRIDKHTAYHDWLKMVADLPEKPNNLTGHFISFCKKRAQEVKP